MSLLLHCVYFPVLHFDIIKMSDVTGGTLGNSVLHIGHGGNVCELRSFLSATAAISVN